MTDSCCWIDIRDDEEVTARFRATLPPGENLDPRRIELGTRYLWISDLRDWAARKGVPIEYPDFGWIVEQVTVGKQQFLEFFEDMLGPIEAGPDPGRIDTLRLLVSEHGDAHGRYRILADEY